MKWIVLLLLVLFVGAFVAAHYRRQVQTGIYLWRMFRKMRQTGKTDDVLSEKRINDGGNINGAPLVRCAKCGKWTAQNKALNLRSKIFYCSSGCLENAVKVG